MNENELQELQRLKRQHCLFQAQLDHFGVQLEQLSAKLGTDQPGQVAEPPGEYGLRERTAPVRITPPPLPPIVADYAPSKVMSANIPASAAVPTTNEVLPSELAVNSTPVPSIEQAQPTPAASPSASAPAPESSLELKLGTYWLVRIGIVMLLTGLVWAGYYAYDNFNLGAYGKLSLLYLASGLLLGLGAWLQRDKETEAIRNFGRVVLAGGLAAVYFTTYAAHYSPSLKIIPNEVLAGALLLGWAGFIVWLADRKKSELLAVFALGLAFYTSAITRIGLFTLYSNLLLTVASLYLLVRNRWAGLSLASLAAAYAGFIFWRFYNDGWFWQLRQDDLQHGNYFLAGYWLVFTAAGFLAPAEKLGQARRAAFLGANNLAYFGLVVLSMLHVDTGSFWKFSLGFGLGLIGLSALATRVHSEEKTVHQTCLTQGLLLVTLGLIAKFSGLTLALLLAAESVALCVLGDLLKNRVLQTGTYIAGILSLVWALHGLEDLTTRGLITNIAVGALLVFNAGWVTHRHRDSQVETINEAAGFFSALGLSLWLFTTWRHAPVECRAPVLALECLLLTASWHWLKIRELTWLGQGFLILAQISWLVEFAGKTPLPWWNPAIVAVTTLAVSHWWQHQKSLRANLALRTVVQAIFGLLLFAVVLFWAYPHFTPAAWMAVASLLGISFTLYSAVTRTWMLSLLGPLFMAASAWEFARLHYDGRAQWECALAPIGTLIITAFLAGDWMKNRDDIKPEVRGPINDLAIIYRALATLLGIWWVFEYIAPREQIWVLVLAASGIFLLSLWRGKTEGLFHHAVFTLCGLGWFALRPNQPEVSVYLPNLLAILALLALQQATRRHPGRMVLPAAWHNSAIVLGTLSLWLLVARWIIQRSGGEHFYLTAGWAGVALVIFAAGFGLRERVYRWLGLGILACALGRVVISDIWKLPTIYRILSFVALGVVLLVLGFLYNKYQQKLREWL